jgi:hypothetical protein
VSPEKCPPQMFPRICISPDTGPRSARSLCGHAALLICGIRAMAAMSHDSRHVADMSRDISAAFCEWVGHDCSLAATCPTHLLTRHWQGGTSDARRCRQYHGNAFFSKIGFAKSAILAHPETASLPMLSRHVGDSGADFAPLPVEGGHPACFAEFGILCEGRPSSAISAGACRPGRRVGQCPANIFPGGRATSLVSTDRACAPPQTSTPMLCATLGLFGIPSFPARPIHCCPRGAPRFAQRYETERERECVVCRLGTRR